MEALDQEKEIVNSRSWVIPLIWPKLLCPWWAWHESSWTESSGWATSNKLRRWEGATIGELQGSYFTYSLHHSSPSTRPTPWYTDVYRGKLCLSSLARPTTQSTGHRAHSLHPQQKHRHCGTKISTSTWVLTSERLRSPNSCQRSEMVFNPTCRMIKRPTNLTPKAPARLIPVRLSQNHQGAEKGLETNKTQFSWKLELNRKSKAAVGQCPKPQGFLTPGNQGMAPRRLCSVKARKLQASQCERK